MEYFFERRHGLVGSDTWWIHEKRSHLALPALIDLALGHPAARSPEVRSFQIADQQSIRPKEQRVVGPARLAKRLEHFRPDGAVPLPILFETLRPHLENEANALH